MTVSLEDVKEIVSIVDDVLSLSSKFVYTYSVAIQIAPGVVPGFMGFVTNPRNVVDPVQAQKVADQLGVTVAQLLQLLGNNAGNIIPALAALYGL